MVTDAILHALGSFVAWVLGLFPTITLPDWLTTVTDFIASVVTGALQLGNWIPWPLVGLAFVFVWLSFGIAFAIRVGRIVASFFTAGGGSAA